ncbi:MAG: hypothetical protein IPG55_14725 [Saprospiraceae bacterium]|nr:hypothetical protein [Candidatus Defluviibacterium haderslevense]MBK7242273.1 hypothetical protein [Candidatus Defluviibacterium haderslevense]MCC7027992.1 hypothetical protein [Saprospiraceae bacterium]
MKELFTFLLILLICLSCKQQSKYVNPSLKIINDTWESLTKQKISKDSLIIIFSKQIKRDPFHRESILLMQSYIDKLETKSQIKFYIDNIFVRPNPALVGIPIPPPKQGRIIPDSKYNTYFMFVLANRKYNFDSVSRYILINKLNDCELREVFLAYYERLFHEVYNNNFSKIIDATNDRIDSCTLKNVKLLQDLIRKY